MPTEVAYSSGHLVQYRFGTFKCSNFETNLSWTCLLSGLLSFEHQSVLLFLLLTPCVLVIFYMNLENKDNTIWISLQPFLLSINVLFWIWIIIIRYEIWRNKNNVVLYSNSRSKNLWRPTTKQFDCPWLTRRDWLSVHNYTFRHISFQKVGWAGFSRSFATLTMCDSKQIGGYFMALICINHNI